VFPRRWLRLDPSRHDWPCVVKLWWSSGAVPWIYQGTRTWWWYKSNLVFTFDQLRCMPSLIHVCS
jgi:hypothetical protein